MPYRRSRWQDIYEEIFGRRPANGGAPTEPEPEVSQTWLPSYIDPPVTSPPPPKSVPDDVLEYEREQERRLGIDQVDPDWQSPDEPDERVQTPADPSPPRTTVPPPTSVPDDILEYEQRLYDRLGLAPPSPSREGSRPIGPVVPDVSPADRIPDIDMFGILPIASGEEPAEPDVWQESTPLTLGQAQHVEHLLDVETNVLAREVLFTLQRDGMPPRSQWNDFMAPYALMGWDATSDAIAWGTLAAIAESDWDDVSAYADLESVETTAQDLGDNAIEGVIVIDAKTGETLFDRTGVVREDGSQYVGMQDHEAKALLAEALSGRELIFLHNHTEEVGASDEDLDSAFRAGAALLIVITPSGREQVFVRGRDRMVLVRDDKASYVVGPENPEETEELHIRSEEQEAAFKHDAPELMFLQSNPEVIANMDVNPDDISRYGELKDFVNTRLDELQGIGEKELLAKIGESMTLLHDIFGYTFKFHEVYDVEANVHLAMAQVHNLGTILFHYLNDLGIKIMRSTHEDTQYILGADERIRELHNVTDYAYRGHVFLPESLGDEDESELKIVYLGSEIEAGAIGHEVAHEIDRRMGDYGTVSLTKEVGPIGSLLWYMKNEIVNQGVKRPKGHAKQGYHFADAKDYLPGGSRAASEIEKGYVREIFADLLAAKVLGPFKDFYSRGDTAVLIGFKKDTRGAAYIAIAMEQYFDHYDDFLSDGSPVPEAFYYTNYHDHQTTYGQLEWPVMPVQGDKK